MNEDELERRLLKEQVRVLGTLSPDDWHRIADAHNWNEPLEPLHWIVSQPNCDRATARLVFWKGEPTAYDLEDCDEEMGEDSYNVEPMLLYIVRRFERDGYPRQEIEFDFTQAKSGSYSSDAAYTGPKETGAGGDFDELRGRVPEELLVRRAPGRRVSAMYGDNEVFAKYPLGIDFDNGELIYDT